MKFLRNLFRRKAEPDLISGSGPSTVLYTSDKDAIGSLILKQLQDRGLIPPGAEVKVSHQPFFLSGDRDFTSWTPDPSTGSMRLDGTIKPPSDSATEGWSWDAWSKEISSMAFPGWSPCRFAHRSTRHGQDTARFVFGITRGPFGLWQNNFDVCSYDGEDWTRGAEILTCLTHLPTGMGLGIFDSKDSAALAADTAIRACPQLADIEYSEAVNGPWSVTMTRAASAWQSLGIIPSTNAHAHDVSTGGLPHMIMGLAENLEQGRPEKLS